jgi:hypothetical protein
MNQANPEAVAYAAAKMALDNPKYRNRAPLSCPEEWPLLLHDPQLGQHERIVPIPLAYPVETSA